MQALPTIGRRSRSRPAAATVAVVLVAIAGGGLYLKLRHDAAARAEAQAAAAAAAARVAAATAAAAAAAAPAAAPEATPAIAPEPAELEKPGTHAIAISLNGPLEKNIVAVAGRNVGLPLTQVLVRALVWWVSVPADLRRGDTVDVLYEQRPGEEPLVQAVRFHSGRSSRYFRAYRFQPAGARFARFYQPDGSELEMRLQDAPLDDYEQVTSLLRDGRGHKGVDFKTPLGTPVKATFDGTIVRRTWNFRANGNSLEVREDGGQQRTATFLHLSELPAESHPGARVKRGQVIAQSGNTGHSFAPHLHYQLGSARQALLDPFVSHPTTRRSLAPSDRTTLEAEIHRLDALLDAGRAGT